MKARCAWCTSDPLYVAYHDAEWGVPVREDQKLFEMLCLEGAQAGLSWITVLKKREAYRNLFHRFDPAKVSQMTDDDLEKILLDPSVIRNRLKVYSVRTNAAAFLKVQLEFGSFTDYLWGFVGGTPIINNFQTISEVPSKTELSDSVSKDLKQRGFKFVGSTIIYAYLQAVGVVNDHTSDCFRSRDL